MIKAFRTVKSEIWNSRKRIWTMSTYNLLFQLNQTRFKLLWTILNPTFQSLVYWIAFHIGLRVSPPIQGVPYLTWMLTGLMPWLFFSIQIPSGANCIINSRGILLNMKFPISIIPVSSALTELLNHLFYLVVLILIQVFSGIVYTVAFWGVLYYLFAMICFALAISFLSSTLTVFFRDIQRILQYFIRGMFFLTPVCWYIPPGSPIQSMEQWNPFAFIIEGYRGTMIYRGDFMVFKAQHLFFWGLTGTLLILGIWLHWKCRPLFADYL